MDGHELLNLTEAATLLHVAPRTMARWHAERTGPPRVRAGRRVLYRRADVEGWLNDHREDYGAVREGRSA